MSRLRQLILVWPGKNAVDSIKWEFLSMESPLWETKGNQSGAGFHLLTGLLV